MDKPLFTVNIAVYNQLEYLKYIIKALERQNFTDFEIIVTDDGSSDGTKEWAKTQNFNYKWQEDEGFRIAKSKNMGIAEARGKYFLSLEGDVIPNFGLLKAYAENVAPNRIIFGVRHDVLRLPKKLDFTMLDKMIVSRDWRTEALERLNEIPNPWRLCSGCNVLFPTDKLREVGGWNEEFKHYGVDDYEVCLRMIMAGCEIMYLPSAYGYHVRHELRETIPDNIKLLTDLEEKYASSN